MYLIRLKRICSTERDNAETWLRNLYIKDEDVNFGTIFLWKRKLCLNCSSCITFWDQTWRFILKIQETRTEKLKLSVGWTLDRIKKNLRLKEKGLLLAFKKKKIKYRLKKKRSTLTEYFLRIYLATFVCVLPCFKELCLKWDHYLLAGFTYKAELSYLFQGFRLSFGVKHDPQCFYSHLFFSFVAPCWTKLNLVNIMYSKIFSTSMVFVSSQSKFSSIFTRKSYKSTFLPRIT